MAQPPSLDATASAANRDKQTVTASGSSVARKILGVKVSGPTVHVDHRGRVFEVFPGIDDYWATPLVYCYTFSVRLNQVKGWGLHLEKDDRYTLICGEVLTVLYDARLESPTHGLIQKVNLSEQGIRQLTIPAGVWHMNVNVAESEAFLINHPTEAYVHDRPDRLLLSWDSPEIPFDLRDVFPVQTGTSVRPAGESECARME